MTVYTSYYGNYRKFPKEAKTISISLKTPPKGAMFKIPLLAPKENIFNLYKANAIDEDRYTELYLEQLEEMYSTKTGRAVVEVLKQYSFQNDTIFILLCYEKSSFCHRHVFRDWFKEKTGVVIGEF